MSILANLHHVTRYTLRPARLARAAGHPAAAGAALPHPRRQLLAEGTPAQHFVNWQQDPYGNWIARFVFPEKATEFSIRSIWWPTWRSVNPFDFFVEPIAEKMPFTYPDESARGTGALSHAGAGGAAPRELLAGDLARARQHRRLPRRAQSRLQRDDPLPDPHGAGRSDAGGDARSGSGSCRDSAWLLVQILRHSGSPRASCPAISSSSSPTSRRSTVQPAPT